MTPREEYEARFHANHKVEGFGRDVTVHYPCPACAAADFVVAKLVETRERLGAGGLCSECGRGFRTLYEDSEGTTTLEIVQTAGPNLPDFLPTIRRMV